MEKTILEKYVKDGKSTREIARILHKSLGSVRYWLKKYELKTDKKAIAQNRSPIYAPSDDKFIQIVLAHQSIAECLYALGVTPRSDNYRVFGRRCKELHIVPPIAKNASHKVKNETIFVKGSHSRRETIKRRILQQNLKKYECAICGLPPIWNNKELVLTIDHINGDSTDNRLENLRFICPNCDRQLPTYCGRNRK